MIHPETVVVLGKSREMMAGALARLGKAGLGAVGVFDAEALPSLFAKSAHNVLVIGGGVDVAERGRARQYAIDAGVKEIVEVSGLDNLVPSVSDAIARQERAAIK